jgi:hypothetical protein
MKGRAIFVWSCLAVGLLLFGNGLVWDARAQQVKAAPTVSQGYIRTDLLRAVQTAPAHAALGSTVQCTITVTPTVDIADCEVTSIIPSGATYVKSEPAAQVDGKTLTWRADFFGKSIPITLLVWYKVDAEGELVNQLIVTAAPTTKVTTIVP